MIITALQHLNKLNESLFIRLDEIIETLPLPHWVLHGLIDSIHMLPFLFIIFVIIELVEYYGATKTNKHIKYSKTTGPILGSLIAAIPQCGFSVIASTLYTKKLITRGTLLAVYLSTSDEAIPVLLAEPSKAPLILPILGVKIIIAILAGYLIDLTFRITNPTDVDHTAEVTEEEKGCCKHNLAHPSKKDLLIHPLIHTLNVFTFILLVTILINYGIMKAGGAENLGHYLLSNSPIQPVITALLGLIPNCAISVAITILYMQDVISFGAVISGLCSSAGLGLLVLIQKNNSAKDTSIVIGTLLLISIVSGLVIQFLS